MSAHHIHCCLFVSFLYMECQTACRYLANNEDEVQAHECLSEISRDTGACVNGPSVGLVLPFQPVPLFLPLLLKVAGSNGM